MTSGDPWKDIELPQVAQKMRALRIPNAGSTDWALYWAVDTQRHCLLVLQFGYGCYHFQRLPQLKGLAVEVSPTEDGTRERVIIRLTDAEQREVFHRFCDDIVQATKVATSAEEAIGRFLTRTWRWHRLLQSGQDGRLSNEEQRGLIGELRFIERYLLEVIDVREALEGWTGPLALPKDFQIGLVGVEVKARSPQQTKINVSSIEQLDLVGMSRLFLSVIEVGTASAASSNSLTVADLVKRVRDRIEALDVSAIFIFDERLNAFGFDREEDYSDKHWSIGGELMYEVTEEFPRLIPSMVPAEVDGITYMVNISSCERFRIMPTVVTEAILGGSDEH